MAELHPQARALLTDARKLPPIYTQSVEDARSRMRAAFVGREPEPIAQVTDISIGDTDRPLRCRAYHPNPTETRPILLFIHGGGWVLNDLDVFDVLCSILANSADCVVFSVDYRRSPEFTYPAALEDARSALDWVVSHADHVRGDSRRVGVAGDSAGAGLAAALTQVVRDTGGPAIRAQLLLYPVLDYLHPPTDSYEERGAGYSVDVEFMEWVFAAYLPETWNRSDPYLFPLQGNLTKLPPAVIYTAEYDVLRDEGAAYAQKLRDAGVPVEFVNAEDQMHGFAMHTRTNARAAELVQRASDRLKELLHG